MNSHSSQIIQWEVFKIICHEPIAIFLPLFTSVDTDKNSGTVLGDVQVRTSSIKSLQNTFPEVFFERHSMYHPALAGRQKILKAFPYSSKVFLLECFPCLTIEIHFHLFFAAIEQLKSCESLAC